MEMMAEEFENSSAQFQRPEGYLFGSVLCLEFVDQFL
jgi:hypothetical protein